MGKIIDIDSIKEISPDKISKYLSGGLASLMDLEHLNTFYESLPVKSGNPSFASTILDSLSITRLVKGSQFPSKGSVVAIVPVVSGILEVVASISEIIESSKRSDIKIMPTNEGFLYFDILSPYLLSTTQSKTTLIYNSIEHLRNGGALIYFVKMNSFKHTVDSHFVIPYKLSRLTHSQTINILIDFDANLKYSWTTLLGSWFFAAFSVRRFFANSGTSMMVLLGDPLNSSDEFSDEINANQSFQSFFVDNINNVNYRSVFNLRRLIMDKINKIVPRGTKF